MSDEMLLPFMLVQETITFYCMYLSWLWWGQFCQDMYVSQGSGWSRQVTPPPSLADHAVELAQHICSVGMICVEQELSLARQIHVGRRL